MGKPLFTGKADSAPKRRGRPRKNPLPGDITGSPQVVMPGDDPRTDKQILEEVTARFAALRTFATGIAERKVRALIVSGAPGIGKTFTIEQVLSHHVTHNKLKLKVVKGFMTAAMLYRLLYENKEANNVVFLDDCDAIFWNDDALNILKAALDTTEHRIVSYRAMNIEGEDIPTEFEFKGAMVFATNIDFHHYIDVAKNRVVEHLKALLSRCQYLSMKLHHRRSVALWVTYMIRDKKMLTGNPHNRTLEESEDILTYLLDNSARITPLMSLRTAVKCVELVNLDAKGWRNLADFTLIKQ